MGDISYSEVIFWPRCTVHERTREADALICMREKGLQLSTLALIEAKFDSGLSNKGTLIETSESIVVENGEKEQQFHHQLADEFCCMKCGYWHLKPEQSGDIQKAQRSILIYITSHFECPQSDLRDCISIINHHKTCQKRTCGEGPLVHIYWLSWRQIYTVIKNEISSCGQMYTTGELRLLNDVLKVLELRELIPFAVFKGFKEAGTFNSIFTDPKLDMLYPGRYYSFVGF